MAFSKDVGSRGLVVFDGNTYSYVTEVDWRGKTKLKSIPQELQKLRETKTVMAKVGQAVYVDLDQIAGLGQATGDVNGSLSFDNATKSVVFREGEYGYQIALTELTELPEGFEGSARVLVTRGAVTAAIPKNEIPSGTYCVLVNLASLK